jgi:hypothetical protein
MPTSRACNRDPGRARRRCRQVRGEPARCHQCLVASADRLTRRELAGLPGGRCLEMAARSRSEADGKAGWKLHAARALLYAGHAIRRQPQRCAKRLYRAYVTRASEFGPENLDNTPLIARIVGCAAKPRDAGLRQLCRGVAGAEDGTHPGAGAGLPARPWHARNALMPSATWPSCAPSRAAIWAWPPRSLGHRLCLGKAARGALRLL